MSSHSFDAVLLPVLAGDDDALPRTSGDPLLQALRHWGLHSLPQSRIEVVESKAIPHHLERLDRWLGHPAPHLTQGSNKRVVIFASPRSLRHTLDLPVLSTLMTHRTSTRPLAPSSPLQNRPQAFDGFLCGVGARTDHVLRETFPHNHNQILPPAPQEGVRAALESVAMRLGSCSVAVVCAKGARSASEAMLWHSSHPGAGDLEVFEVHELSPLIFAPKLQHFLSSAPRRVAVVAQSAATLRAFLAGLGPQHAPPPPGPEQSPGLRLVIFARGASAIEALRASRLPHWVESWENTLAADPRPNM